MSDETTKAFAEPGDYAEAMILVTPKPQSKLRLVAGSDGVVIFHPSRKPNAVVRWLTRILLRMEWLDA